MPEKDRPFEQMLELNDDEALSAEHLDSEVQKELSRALSTVDDARTEYSEQRSRLQAAEAATGESSLPDAAADAYQSSNGRSFFQWLQIGLALTLPLIIFGAVALLFFFWMASK